MVSLGFKPGQQDGKQRQIHWAMAAPIAWLFPLRLLSFLPLRMSDYLTQALYVDTFVETLKLIKSEDMRGGHFTETSLPWQCNLISAMELFSRRRWRLVSAQLSNKFGFCPLYTVSIVLQVHKHNSLPLGQIWAFISRKLPRSLSQLTKNKH